MKKVLLAFIVLAVSMNMNAQMKFDLGLGYGFSDQDLIFVIDFQTSKGIALGMQCNIGFDSSVVGEDYSEVINIGEYYEDIYGLGYSSYSVAFRVGKEFAEKISVIGALGWESEKEVQNRYDNFHILGDNGYYSVATGNRETKLYVSLNAKYRATDWLALEAGYGSRGFEVKAFYTF